MIDFLEEIIEDGYRITRYTTDGKTVSHEIKTLIVEEIEEDTTQPTVEERLEAIEQNSAYTQIQVEYLTMLTEISNGL
ncbi:hypothetical protein QI30_08865 [Kurthia sp. 3B1D]|uniref:Uncharacterized protein n=1 Tax=Candidatus Kurthia intestinigallinarum TaxID=1562256 RepID=A0A433RSD7_9BACL|nr:hypothetical protein [Kurthia sp. 3B1D]RUS55069.1 hypothetical protein QI30_08865 [Kurthia sp. 3B1D]